MLNSNDVRWAKIGKLKRGRELTFITCIYVYIYSKYIDVQVGKTLDKARNVLIHLRDQSVLKKADKWLSI